MKKTKTIAISMITLVIMIPIYSAMVFGDWDIISIGGNDGAHKGTTGYMGEDDTLVVKLNSDYGDVRCSCNPNTPLECTPKDTGYECSFYDDTGAEAGKYDFSFYRFDGSRPIGNSIPASVIVDNEKPTITFDAVFNGNISVSFTAKDTALEGGCSGIKTVKFFINGREWKTYDKSSLVGACEFSGSAEYVPPTSDGLKKMHAIAFDYVGNYQRSDFVELYVDTTHPKISSVYLKRGNARLDYISNKPLSGTKVVILFEEHDLSNDGVVADLSRLTLNPAKAAGYTHVPFSCIDSTQEEDVYICTSQYEIEVLLTSPSAQIRVDAVDVYGNEKNDMFHTINLNYDTATPGVTLLGTKNCDSNQCYLKNGINLFNVLISDTGAGFNNAQVFVKSPELGIPNRKRLSSCKEENGLWDCIGSQNIGNQIDGDESELMLVYPSEDDVGNKIPPQSATLVYDETKPKLIDYADSIVFKRKGTNIPVITSFSKMKIELRLRDPVSGVKEAWVDLSSVIPGLGWTKATKCGVDSDYGFGYYLCEWITGATSSGPRTIKNIKFKATDFAGNENNDIVYPELKIYTTTDNNQTFWEISSVTADPPVIDRTVSQYIPGTLNVWFKVDLVADSSVRLVHAEIPTDCEGLTINNVRDSRLYPVAVEGASTKASVFGVIELRKEVPLPDTANQTRFKCPIALTTAVGNTVYPPEIVEADVSVGLDSYGFDVPADYAARIDSFKDDIKDRDWIAKQVKFFNVVRTTCQLMQTIMTLWNVITGNLLTTASILESNVVTYKFGFALSKGEEVGNKANEGLLSTVSLWTCGFVDCTLFPRLLGEGPNGINWYTKFIEFWTNSVSGSMPNFMKKDVLETKGQFPDVWAASQQSIVISAFALCYPGILHNLEKARQIDCMYVDCAESWTAAGFNPYTCEAMRANSYCNFIWGQIFHIIPYTGLVDWVGNLVRTFTSSPIAMAGMIYGYVCAPFIGKDAAKKACRIPNTIFQVTSLISGITRTVKSFGGADQDYCKEIGI